MITGLCQIKLLIFNFTKKCIIIIIILFLFILRKKNEIPQDIQLINNNKNIS
jgi:hypothetical protein